MKLLCETCDRKGGLLYHTRNTEYQYVARTDTLN